MERASAKHNSRKQCPKTVPATFSIEEPFDLGEDAGSPVNEDVYAVPFSEAGCNFLYEVNTH